MAGWIHILTTFLAILAGWIHLLTTFKATYWRPSRPFWQAGSYGRFSQPFQPLLADLIRLVIEILTKDTIKFQIKFIILNHCPIHARQVHQAQSATVAWWVHSSASKSITIEFVISIYLYIYIIYYIMNYFLPFNIIIYLGATKSALVVTAHMVKMFWGVRGRSWRRYVRHNSSDLKSWQEEDMRSIIFELL